MYYYHKHNQVYHIRPKTALELLRRFIFHRCLLKQFEEVAGFEVRLLRLIISQVIWSVLEIEFNIRGRLRSGNPEVLNKGRPIHVPILLY